MRWTGKTEEEEEDKTVPVVVEYQIAGHNVDESHSNLKTRMWPSRFKR